MVILGDDSGIQTDVKNKQDGLDYLIGIMAKYDIRDSSVVYFGYDDIFRSDITKDFVIAFDKELQEKKKKETYAKSPR